jgi:hypothetical protein
MWAFVGIAVLFVVTIVAFVKALSHSSQFNRAPAKWWFAGTILSFGLLGLMVAWTFTRRSGAAPNQPSPLALGVLLGYALGAWIGVLIFPLSLGRALYKIKHGDDFTITHIRKPRTQYQYEPQEYQCGKCKGYLPEPVGKCPHCGAWLGGTEVHYARGTPLPKLTTTATFNTTRLAGVLVYLWLLLNMVFAVTVLVVKHSLTWPETLVLALPSLVVLLVVDLAIVGIALLVRRRCVKLGGHVTRETLYQQIASTPAPEGLCPLSPAA